jgi:PEGA domain-containing protein
VSEANEPARPAPENQSRLRVVFTLIVVIALGALLAWWLRPPARPPVSQRTAESRPASPAAPARVPEPAPAPPAPPAATPSRRDRPRTPVASAPDARPAPVVARRLKVTSDVDGAFVFVDRKFVGKTPLDTPDVAPGHHQLNVSSEGYEGVSQGVEIAEQGTTEVDVSLKTVRLNASVDVVHKHGVGSCEGKLFADTRGLRYDTTNRDDRFTLSFADIETFTLDYRQKTLRVKRREGRTWNFTTRAANADPLLVFQRDVDRARARLAH